MSTTNVIAVILIILYIFWCIRMELEYDRLKNQKK